MSGGLFIAGGVYAAASSCQPTSLRGVRRARLERASFAGGWAVLLVALASPLDGVNDVLFAAHMTQHELLMLVAAPLMVLGRPLTLLPWLLPPARRIVLLRQLPNSWLSIAWQRLTMPVTALLVHGLIVWVAHVPVLFEAALAHDGLHAVQHLLLFWSAALFWWALIHGRFGRLGYGMSVLFVFVTALHTSLLGALMTFAPSVWYPTYEAAAAARGGDALSDQQLAGMLMWIPAGTLFLVIGLALFAAWMGQSERRSRHARWNTL